MGFADGEEQEPTKQEPSKKNEGTRQIPLPSAPFRRRAWTEFQRALDPLAPPKPLRHPPH